MARVNESRVTSEPTPADWGGFATFSGAIMTVFQPNAVASTLLPPPLQLTTSTSSGHKRRNHPIVFIVGEMAHGGTHWGGLDVSSGLQYRELAVMIPFVRHPVHEGPTVFSCQMLADDVRPVVLGNSFYGLRKDLAKIQWEGASYRAQQGDKVLFQCAGSLSDRWSPGVGNADVGLGWLEGTFALPILGLRRSTRYVLSRFCLDFRTSHACPIDAEISWCPARELPSFHWRSDRAHSYAIRQMGWRTGPPRPLRPT
jgi:hypothetical protein